ncbi:MAG: DUF6850 family outer membrane beta-barrel protein [Gemmatimonadales bacterium]
MSRVTARAVIVAAMTAPALIAPAGVSAQNAAVDVSDSPRLWRWTPLWPIADLGMPAPRLPELPRLLELPAPRVGVASIGGNPAGLPDEINSAWTQLVVSTNGVGGSYHRPLDPGSVSSIGTSLAGWRRIGARAAAIGRVAVERDDLSGGSYSALVAPYGSSPFVPADTNRPTLGRTIVTLEGAEGIALGDWRLGIAAGYRAQANSSSQSSASQIGRASSSGLALGAVRALGSGARVGLYGRGLQNSETVDLIANPAIIRVYPLDGYTSPDPADYIAALPPFLRRADRTATSWGADFDGHAFGTAWAAYLERQSLQERQLSDVLASSPPTDHWRASGYAVGGSAQRTVRGWLATVRADWSAQRGDADRAVANTGAYRADASRLALAAEARYASAVSPWTLAAALSLGRDQQKATDDAARMTTDIVAWTPGASAEIARRVSDRLIVSLGYARSQFTPFAGVRSPANRGTAYTLLVAPAIEVAAATASTDQGGVTARWQTGAGVVSFRLWAASTRPVSRPDASVPLPSGDRSSWGFAMSLEPAR